jgi:sulfur-carrier protein
MKVRIIIFGQLTDITGKNELTLPDVNDTGDLVTELNKLYPALAASRYILAVDKQTVNGNVNLKEGSVVALLPPFSGG